MLRHLPLFFLLAFDFGITDGDVTLEEAASFLVSCCGDDLQGELRERSVGCDSNSQGLDAGEARCVLRLDCDRIRGAGLCATVLTEDVAGNGDQPPVEVCR